MRDDAVLRRALPLGRGLGRSTQLRSILILMLFYNEHVTSNISSVCDR